MKKTHESLVRQPWMHQIQNTQSASEEHFQNLSRKNSAAVSSQKMASFCQGTVGRAEKQAYRRLCQTKIHLCCPLSEWNHIRP